MSSEILTFYFCKVALDFSIIFGVVIINMLVILLNTMIGINTEKKNNSINQSSENTESEYGKYLFPQLVNSYGEKYKDHYLDIYKSFVGTPHEMSTLKQSSNSFFLTLNTAIITIVSYLQLGKEASQSTNAYWLISLSGIIICFAWYRLIKSYESITLVKLNVIRNMEHNLPLAPYRSEFEEQDLKEKPTNKIAFSEIEATIPLVFLAIHFIVLIIAVPWQLNIS